MKSKLKQHPDMTEAFDRIRREIRRQGWLYCDLSRKAGVSNGLISKWVDGKVKYPRFENLVAVAAVLRLNVRLTLTRS